MEIGLTARAPGGATSAAASRSNSSQVGVSAGAIVKIEPRSSPLMVVNNHPSAFSPQGTNTPGGAHKSSSSVARLRSAVSSAGGADVVTADSWLCPSPSSSQLSMNSLSPPPPPLMNGNPTSATSGNIAGSGATSSAAGVAAILCNLNSTSSNASSSVNNNNSCNGMSPLSCSSGYDAYSPRGKEEMSPPATGSLNGAGTYFVDSSSFDKKNNNNNNAVAGNNNNNKKVPAPRQQEELCLVCGDRASGYHYNALTCEGCKGFFRRSITKDAVYQCKYGNNCDIDMYMRRKCQECRLKKCLAVGMRPECVVPEYQCAIKRESKKHQKGDGRHSAQGGCSATSPPSSDPLDPLTPIPPIAIASPAPIQRVYPRPGVQPLTHEQEELINKLVYFQQEFESPAENDIKKITAFPLGETEEDNQRRFQHITEITILTVQLIVEFSKRVPGFDTLLREDQITLLKACSSEVMMLRGARKYDVSTDSIVFANNQPYTRDNYRSASVGDSADALFRFCRNMCNLRVDNAEYALLTAIVIFSERPSLVEPEKVEKIQEFYIETLRTYSDNHRKTGRTYFARLLAVLTELRTLGNMNAEMCFSLQVQQKKLPPFLAEIWDIQE